MRVVVNFRIQTSTIIKSKLLLLFMLLYASTIVVVTSRKSSSSTSLYCWVHTRTLDPFHYYCYYRRTHSHIRSHNNNNMYQQQQQYQTQKKSDVRNVSSTTRTTSIKRNPDNNTKTWTLCTKCHGEGRFYRSSSSTIKIGNGSSRRRRTRHHHHILTDPNWNKDSAITTTTIATNDSIPKNTINNSIISDGVATTTTNSSCNSVVSLLTNQSKTQTSTSVVSTILCKVCSGSGLLLVQQQQQEFENALSVAVPTTITNPISVATTSDTNVDTSQQQPPPYSTRRRPIHIAIIGGGIGGMALAIACLHRNISCTIYERDVSFDSRKQGYGLTLQQASKQLLSLGIVPDDLIHVRQCGIISTKHIVHDTNGTVKGTWGLRHWLGGNNETDTTTNSNDINNNDDHDVKIIKTQHISTESAIENGMKQTTKQQSKNRRQNIHIARQALRHELYIAAMNAATATNVANSECFSNTNEQKELLSSIIQWNHRLVRYDEKDDGVELTFAVPMKDNTMKNNNNGEDDTTTRLVHTTADIIIGADGIRSQVRQQFFGSDDTTLRYLGCIVILGICSLDTLDYTVIKQSSFDHLLDGQTVFQTADGITRIYMMPYSHSEYMWQLSFPMTEDKAIEFSRQGPETLRNIAMKRCGQWHIPVPLIIQATPSDLVTGYPVYDREIVQPQHIKQRSCSGSSSVASVNCGENNNGDKITQQFPSRRITFIGDSIHCMSPFKGQGANQALLDALSLARYLYKAIRRSSIHRSRNTSNNSDMESRDEIAKKQKQCSSNELCELSGEDIEQVLLEYEKEMLLRSSIKVQASADAAHFLHTSIAIQEGNVTRGAAAAALSTKTSSTLEHIK